LAALSLSIVAMTGMIADLEPDAMRMKKAAGKGYATATDLADWLVRALNIPFRNAYHVANRVVAKAAEAGGAPPRGSLSGLRGGGPPNVGCVFNGLFVGPSGKKPNTLRWSRPQKNLPPG